MATPDPRRRGQLIDEAGLLVEQARLVLKGPALANVVERHAEMARMLA